MSIKTICAGIGALALIGGLGACGAVGSPAAAPTVHVTQTVAPTPTVTKTVAPTPTPTVTRTVAPVPANTVYVPPAAPAAPAAPALTACGGGSFGEEVYAGPDTSCPFALNVEQAWSQAEASTFYTYSPVTGSNYLMTVSGTSSDGDLTVTGGNNALVEFNP